MHERVIKQAEHTIYGSLSKFQEAKGHPSGVLTVMNGGLPIDIRNDHRGYDVTTVFFHAALTGGTYRHPVFTGAGISEDLPTNRVFIADPSLHLDDRLMLSWYAGNRKQPRLQWVIRAIIKALVPEGQRVVTFGASGGGFAALYYAANHPNAVAVPVNPQTNLAKYLPSAVGRYTRLGWGLTGPNALKDITAVTDLRRLYRSAPARVFYIQNRNDTSHVAAHFEPFMAALPEQHRVYPVLVDGASGHKPPPKGVTRAVLEAAIAGEESPLTGEALDNAARSVTAKRNVHAGVPRKVEWPASEEPTSFESLAAFMERGEPVEGNIEIMHNGRPIHINWREKGKATTLVMFTASVRDTVLTVPVFSGRRVAANLNANVLMISDPTLQASSALTLGYYAGSTVHPELQCDLTSIISSLSEGHRVIFFGGSGGGFPALEQGSRFPGSTVFLLNPLTHVNLIKRGTHREYFWYAWNRQPPEVPSDVPFVNSTIDTYSRPVDTQVICLQNARDDFHIEHYWQPFVAALHPENRVLTLSPALGEGHTGPNKESMTRLFECVVENDDWDKLTQAARNVKITHLPE